MKNKLKGAETGHSLLKRKSEALTKFVIPCLITKLTLISYQAISRCVTASQTLRLMAKVSRDNEAN